MMRTTIPAEELLSKARAVGQYYGFTPLTALTASARGKARKTFPQSLDSLELEPAASAVTGFLKRYQHVTRQPSSRVPHFIWHTNIAPGRPAQKKTIVQFHALGSDRPIADAVVIRALIALARDLFHEEPIVRINSMGDRETRARYARELTTFFKKRTDTLPPECVARAREDVFGGAELAISRECADELPAPTEHLSDASRKRFEDLLEYLEMTETPYELARTLLSRGPLWNDTCFEITVGERRVAWGSRYHELARHFFPYSLPAIGAVFQVASEGTTPMKLRQPRLRISFIHIGDEAKHLSIRLAEELRRAHVPLTQDIGVESLTEQLHLAERRDSPFLLIMGRKEALEHSAILRNRKTQEQIIVPLDNLIERLKSVA